MMDTGTPNALDLDRNNDSEYAADGLGESLSEAWLFRELGDIHWT